MDPEINTLSIEGATTIPTLKKREGGYSLKRGKITISVSTHLGDQQRKKGVRPTDANICIANAAASEPLQVGDVFEHTGGMLDDTDKSHLAASGYFGFHAERVWVRWVIVDLKPSSVVFSVEAKYGGDPLSSDGVDERTCRGLFDLAPRKRSRLWT